MPEIPMTVGFVQITTTTASDGSTALYGLAANGNVYLYVYGTRSWRPLRMKVEKS